MVVAYYILHYGSDYLEHSIRSIYSEVDRIVCIFTDSPTHGHLTTLKNPDTRQAMSDAIGRAQRVCGGDKHKIQCLDWTGMGEGLQRDFAVNACLSLGAKHILVVDADEIWDTKILQNFINQMKAHPNIREFRIRMASLWRSFHMVCFDNMLPTRGINLIGEHGTYHYPEGRVWHFGYAREFQHIEYKMAIHGHKDEIRPGWLERFKKWPEGGNLDLHPTCVNMWNAEPLNRIFLPSIMLDHPYWNRALI